MGQGTCAPPRRHQRRAAETHKAPAPRFRLFERGGLDILVLGVVGDDQLDDLPPALAAKWELVAISTAIVDARRAATTRLGHPPDLVVLLSAAHRADRQQAETAVGVDLVLGPFDRWRDHVTRHTTVELLDERGGREAQPLTLPALVAQSGPYNIGRVEASFTRAAAEPVPYWRLTTLSSTDRPAVLDGLNNEVFAKERGVWLRRYIVEGEPTLLPDLAQLLDDELREMVFGDRVLSHLGWRERPDIHVAQFSDPLWMRLVANIMREELDTDAALAVNLPRGDTVTGPLPRAVLMTWLPAHPTVARVKLSGAQLIALANAVVTHNQGDPVPRERVFSAGIDLKGKRIGGRQIDPRDRYTVALTDTLLRIPSVKAVLGGADLDKAFVVEGGEVQDGAKDDRASVREVARLALERNASGDQDTFGSKTQATLKRWLHDGVDTLQRQAKLSVEDLSISGSAYRNTPNSGMFAASRETRTTTPNLFQLGFNGRLTALYDGPWFATEAGATGQLTSILLDIPDVDLPPQEQRDG